ncbi:hypothetical protein SG34_007025 [Thalassomonas viridans]|uniref:Galactose oxidase n=1 Tax=Thalassomonas viridans TaxID=137584 RepID=A0AAE9Z5I1_9GAMM|nr:kelch repeat-containing protein [Thalassomonas viridans]WDE06652.1 hypothetical protein SG34_007025 [Thalassomonas viridans]
MKVTSFPVNMFIGLFIACGSGLFTDVQAKQSSYSWASEQSLATPIQEIYPSVFDNEIYVTGGFVPAENPVFFGLSPSLETFIFNPKTKLWRPGTQLPQARHHLGLVSNSKYLYGIGGFAGEKGKAWQIKDTVYRMPKNSDKWSPGPKLPVPLAESVYASVNNNIHVIGGKTISEKTGRNVDTNKHFVLVDNKRWVEAAPPSIVRNSAASAVLAGKIYVFGGRTAGAKPDTKPDNKQFAEVYDVSLDKWHPIKPLPVASAGLSAAVLNGKIIVTGGEAFGPNGNWKTGKAYSQAWSYDPATDAWTEISSMPSARHGHGAVSLNNKVYIIGGAAKVGPQETLASTIVLTEKKKSGSDRSK